MLKVKVYHHFSLALTDGAELVVEVCLQKIDRVLLSGGHKTTFHFLQNVPHKICDRRWEFAGIFPRYVLVALGQAVFAMMVFHVDPFDLLGLGLSDVENLVLLILAIGQDLG